MLRRHSHYVALAARLMQGILTPAIEWIQPEEAEPTGHTAQKSPNQKTHVESWEWTAEDRADPELEIPQLEGGLCTSPEPPSHLPKPQLLGTVMLPPLEVLRSASLSGTTQSELSQDSSRAAVVERVAVQDVYFRRALALLERKMRRPSRTL